MNLLLHRFHIRLLLALSPTSFFHKLNKLDWYKTMLREWADDSQSKTKLKILELACETGSLSSYLSSQGHHVTGLDLSPKMIQRAKTNHPDIDFLEGDASKLSFNDNEFDVVLAASLINIAPSAQKIITEMARVCKQDGIMKILIPAKDFDDDKLKQTIDHLKLSGFSEAAITTWHKFPPKMSLSDLNILLGKSGLIVESHQYFLNKMLLAITVKKH